MHRFAIAGLAGLLVTFAGAANAENAPGVTETEIKFGQTMPYSGPASSFSSIGKAEAAYFNKINKEGGVNGRKLNMLSVDDNYSPPKALEQTRRLVEQEGVAFMYQTLGAAVNSAIYRYLNQNKVPHIFIAAAASRFADPANNPWTIGWQVSSASEGAIFARYAMDSTPNAKLGIIYQNDEFGKDFYNGFKRGLGERGAKMVVAEASYEAADATVDQQLTLLRSKGADTLYVAAIPKHSAQIIRSVFDSGWKPRIFLVSVSSSIGLTLRPAGTDKAAGIISAQFYKDASDPQWANDPATQDFLKFMKEFYPDGDVNDATNVNGYSAAQTLVHTLKQAGNDLSRDNIMKQATNIKDLQLPMLLPGVKLNTSPTDYRPIKQMRMMKFDGSRWQQFGDVIGD